MSGTSTAGRRTSGFGRPTSSASRTHVPSITSHAFFRPMSSQRLQAQRAQRSTTTVHTGASVEGFSDHGSNTNRHSIGSNPRLPQGLIFNQDLSDPPPGSRGTQGTHPGTPDRDTANNSPSAWGTMRSMTDSITPLQDRSASRGGPDPREKPGNDPTSHKSPKPSFRSNFLPGSRSTAQSKSANQNREKLSSALSSPRSGQMKDQQPLNYKTGKNYQYFQGNTVFCLGGRLQNTRHRPVNIITGLFVLVPGALFLAYSSVLSVGSPNASIHNADISHQSAFLGPRSVPSDPNSVRLPLLYLHVILYPRLRVRSWGEHLIALNYSATRF